MILECSSCNDNKIDDKKYNYFEVHHWIMINNKRELENEIFCSITCLKEFLD